MLEAAEVEKGAAANDRRSGEKAQERGPGQALVPFQWAFRHDRARRIQLLRLAYQHAPCDDRQRGVFIHQLGGSRERPRLPPGVVVAKRYVVPVATLYTDVAPGGAEVPPQQNVVHVRK